MHKLSTIIQLLQGWYAGALRIKATFGYGPLLQRTMIGQFREHSNREQVIFSATFAYMDMKSCWKYYSR